MGRERDARIGFSGADGATQRLMCVLASPTTNFLSQLLTREFGFEIGYWFRLTWDVQTYEVKGGW